LYIKDLFKSNKTVVSFETFPPKETTAYEAIVKAIDEISGLKPDYISVTYGAGGGTSKNTVKIVSHIENDLKTTAMAHLSCVSSTEAEIRSILEELKNNNIKNILALRGDIPKDSSFPNPEKYKYASELVEFIKKFDSDFCVAGACYPEGHQQSSSLEQDIENLKLKVNSGCDMLISQLFFDNDKMYGFMEKIRKKGINVPVEAGIMPITAPSQINRMVELSGAYIPKKFKKLLEKYGDNPQDLKKAGVEYSLEQIEELINFGIEGIHIYTMNKPDVAQKIIKGIR